MLRIDLRCCLAAAIALSAAAEPYQVESTPVTVTVQITAKPLAALFDDVTTVQRTLAGGAITRLHEQPRFDYWQFAPSEQQARIRIVIAEPVKNKVTGTLEVIGCDSGARFDEAVLIEPAQIEAEGWPGPTRALVLLGQRIAEKLLTDDNLTKLWPRLRDCAEVGKIGRWHTEAKLPWPMMVLPIRWNDRFTHYNCIVRVDGTAGSGAATSVIFGSSMRMNVAAKDKAAAVDVALVARAQCVDYDGDLREPKDVPKLLEAPLAPVFLEETSPGKVKPLSARCDTLRRKP